MVKKKRKKIKIIEKVEKDDFTGLTFFIFIIGMLGLLLGGFITAIIQALAGIETIVFNSAFWLMTAIIGALTTAISVGKMFGETKIKEIEREVEVEM